jgi:hypothetical protein
MLGSAGAGSWGFGTLAWRRGSLLEGPHLARAKARPVLPGRAGEGAPRELASSKVPTWPALKRGLSSPAEPERALLAS